MEKAFKYIVPGIDGGGSQVFEADSQEELIEKLGKAQENATQKIIELAQQSATLGDKIQQAQPNGNGYDKQQFFNTFYEDPTRAMDSYFEQRFGMKPDDFIADYQSTRNGSQRAIQNEVAAAFAQRHPELLQVGPEEDKHNGNVIANILTEHGWQWNERNLEAAYAVAQTSGKLKLNQQPQFPEANLPPAPTTISRPTGAENTSVSENDFLATAPLGKVKEYLEKKYGAAK